MKNPTTMRKLSLSPLLLSLWLASSCTTTLLEPELTGAPEQYTYNDALCSSFCSEEQVCTADQAAFNTPEEAYQAVLPFVGTGGGGYGFSALTPAAQVPLGFVRLGPDTTMNGAHGPQQHMGGYNIIDQQIRGFSHTHFVGTGVADYGNLRFMVHREQAPKTGSTEIPFAVQDREQEDAEPGYYATFLVEPKTHVALTATARAGFHRYTTQGKEPTYITIDVTSSVRGDGVQDAQVEVTSEGLIEGFVVYKGGYVGRQNAFTLHFSAKPSTTFDEHMVWDADGPKKARSGKGKTLGVSLKYDRELTEPLEFRVGVSLVDLEYARKNRTEELPEDQSFEDIRESTKRLWLDKLSRVRVSGGTFEERQVFFTALYNTYRMPTRLDERDGSYRGLDGEVHKADGHAYYTDLSLWDSFRTTHPWYILYDPELQRDCLMSLLAMYKAGGVIPRWPAGLSYTGGMIGTSADHLFGGSAIKGIENVDWKKALEAVLITANGAPPEGSPFGGRRRIEDYLELGYIPYESTSTSVSRALEFAYNDWSIANLASVVGDTKTEETFRKRAKNYMNVFDEETKFFRARSKDGSFKEPFDPAQYQESGGADYTEGSAWHWRFYAPHDLENLMKLFGGKKPLATELDTFFSKSALSHPKYTKTLWPDPYYWHGNQPPLHSVFLFQIAERPDMLAYWTNRIRERLYTTLPSGLPGNDDGGTLSAWYLLSAMGLYPIAGDDRYIIGTPLFERMYIERPDGNDIFIEAPRKTSTQKQATALQVDCQQHTGPYITHDKLLGNTLTFTMEELPVEPPKP